MTHNASNFAVRVTNNVSQKVISQQTVRPSNKIGLSAKSLKIEDKKLIRKLLPTFKLDSLSIIREDGVIWGELNLKTNLLI